MREIARGVTDPLVGSGVLLALFFEPRFSAKKVLLRKHAFVSQCFESTQRIRLRSAFAAGRNWTFPRSNARRRGEREIEAVGRRPATLPCEISTEKKIHYRHQK